MLLNKLTCLDDVYIIMLLYTVSESQLLEMHFLME